MIDLMNISCVYVCVCVKGWFGLERATLGSRRRGFGEVGQSSTLVRNGKVLIHIDETTAPHMPRHEEQTLLAGPMYKYPPRGGM